MIKIYKGAFSGTLPITISGTGSGVLESYKIFGNDSGVGVETEASGYKLPILSNSVVTDIYIGNDPLAKDEYVDSATGKIYKRTKNLSPPEEEWVDGQIGGGDGTVHPSTQIKVSPFIDVSTCETCIMEVFSAETEWAAAGYREMAFYDENKQYLGRIGGGGRQALTPNPSENLSEFPAGTVYVRISCSHGNQPFYPQLVSGYTPTHQFYPYLVPTDPPAPFPQIPTSASSTTIGWAGEALAPSQFNGVAGWGNLPVHQLKGVPYTGTLPATLQTVRGYLVSYKIYGNTVQSGTPTPENPIMPSGCGVRTVNLFDKDATLDGYWLSSATGVAVPQSGYSVSDYIRTNEGESYTNVEAGKTFCWYDENKSFIRTTTQATTASAPTGAAYFRVNLYTGNKGIAMVVAGSTAPTEYIPYGYKLPLTANGVEYPIYLGEAETTRRIKKLVLTGEEFWVKSGAYQGSFYAQIVTGVLSADYTAYCSHLAFSTLSRYAKGTFCFNGGAIKNCNLWINEFDSNTTVDDFKSYLAAQYAAGTPVTVWYVLAEPEPTIANEPLMKIGDYADTIDSTQSTVQVPTSAGSTTISWAGEGLAPSQFDSIQEWVDIPTYKRVNGKWIANFKTVIYGFHVDPSVADPANAVTYILDAVGKTPATNSSSGVDYSDWADSFFMPKPCMLNFDGTVAYYLDSTDYTKKEDGTASDVGNPDFDGNAMMEWPLIWFKYEAGETEGEYSFYVSNRRVDNSYWCPCNINSDNQIVEHFYTAIYNGTSAAAYSTSSTYDVGAHVTYSGAEYRCTTAVATAEEWDSGKWTQISSKPRLRSLSGIQLTSANGNGNTTGAVELERALANNTTATVEWYTDVWADRVLINGLLTLMSKSLDSQTSFGRGIDSGPQAAKEAYVTGTLNDKGLFYGVTANGNSAVKVFGMENWWGCAWRRIAGLVGNSAGGYAYKMTYSNADGSTATSYNSNGSGYLTAQSVDGTAISRPANGYVTRIAIGAAGGWFPQATGGSNSTYYCDNYYSGTGYLLAGGGLGNAALCGCWFLYLSYAFGRSSWNVAAAPSCKPKRSA